MTHILLSIQGTMGDVVPILRIGSILKAAGNSVTLITHCAYEQLARQAGLEFVAFDTSQEFERYIEDISLCETPQGNIVFLKRHVLPIAEREAALLSERCTQPDTILVGNQMFFVGVQLAAEKMSLPMVRIFPGAVNVARFFLFEILYGEVLAEEINALRIRVGLPKISDWAAWARSPQRNIGAWPGWFAPPEPDWPQGLELILPGFLTMDELEQSDIPADLDEFLQAGEPPVLITGTTGTYLKKGFYEAAIEGCRLSGRRGVLVTRSRESIPGPLPEQIKWFPYLPFVRLMPRFSAIIHHGGLGTLALALRAGIPQLVLAMGADRPDHGQRLQRLGVGQYLPPAQWKPGRVAEALDHLVDSPAVRERCQQLAHQAQSDDPVAVIKNIVQELTLKQNLPGGSALPIETGPDRSLIS